MIQSWFRCGGARVAGGLLALVALAHAAPGAAFAQGTAGTPPEPLVNGDMETLDAAGNLTGWRVRDALLEAGYAIGPEHDDVFQGKGAAHLDSLAVTPGGDVFGNLSQSLDARAYQGKRVRFRAAVKVAEAEEGGQAQLWLRVDLAAGGGANRMGFFDNMGDRPIRSKEWQSYEIVGDVAPDAQTIVLGVLTLGQCYVLVDEATFEVVGTEATQTGSAAQADAPRQAFFTAWLVLPLVALALFALGFLAPGRVGKFALGFTLAYWTLYTLSTLVSSLVPVWGVKWSSAYEAGPADRVVRWAAAHVLGIKGELVSPIQNGSGDTTHSYVQALVMFALALAVGALGLLVDRRATDHARVKDLLRSALRYYLAVMMLGYGLSKLSALYNQFSVPGLERLGATYGESSPMGLLWTFMGSSRAYTFFAGAMEFVGGFLLLWRRTALLGALASVSVMLNVVLLNFCYDTPVKLFSFHLVVAAACIALPDARRLVQLFVGLGSGGLGSGAASALASPFTGRTGTWVHRALKAYAIVMVLVLPTYGYWSTERSVAAALPVLGAWKLAELQVDGQAVTPGSGEVKSLTVSRQLIPAKSGWTTDAYGARVDGSATSATVKLTADRLTLSSPSGGSSRLVPGDFSWRVVDDVLHLETPTVHATFTPAANDFLLMRRGFRWINEHPFNR